MGNKRRILLGRLYDAKNPSYFRNLNTAVVSLLEPAGSMLEIGCGAGELGKYAREKGLFQRIVGWEINASAARRALRWYDTIRIGDAEELAGTKMFPVDAIVCADVLEHLVDPWETFACLMKRLRMGGYAIISIPNARHVRVWGNLVLRGRIDYRESGVLDKGHLRFFGRKNVMEMIEQNGGMMEKMVWNMDPKGKLATRLSFGILREFFTVQFVVKIRKHREIVGSGS